MCNFQTIGTACFFVLFVPHTKYYFAADARENGAEEQKEENIIVFVICNEQKTKITCARKCVAQTQTATAAFVRIYQLYIEQCNSTIRWCR